MKKTLFIIFIILIQISGIVSAEESYCATFLVTPFESKITGAREPKVINTEGSSVVLDLQVMEVTAAIEPYGQRLAFSFDHPLELESNGVRAEVTKIILDEGCTAHLRTPTMDAGSDLEIHWINNSTDLLYRDFIHYIGEVLAQRKAGHDSAYEDYSVMFEMQSNWEGEKTLGYALMDIDGDGVNELLFGEIHPDQTGTVLYDLYTIRSGQIKHVFDGWDRNRYYLTTDGGILRQGSNSAFEFFTSYYVYANGELQLLRSVIHDANKNPDSPWFLSYVSVMDPSMGRPISEEDAQSILDYYSCKQIELIPFEN